jgi:multiple sugar transport system permease protein
LSVIATLDSRSRAAGRGWSDLTIRNLFIIPTIVFLIVFNIFPLIYSLGFSFTEYRASLNQPAVFVGLQNYRELLSDPAVWDNFTITAQYVIVSVGGQMIVGFGLALLLNRPFRFKGLVTTLLLLPMMLSPAVVGLFWKLLYDPSWGPVNYVLGIGKFEWLSRIPLTRSLQWQLPTSGCGRRSSCFCRLPDFRQFRSISMRQRPSTAPADGTHSGGSHFRWCRHSC